MQQVDAGDLFADGVLHLHPRVGFHKVETPRLCRVEEEFEGADAAVLHVGRQLQGGGDHGVAHTAVQVGAGGDFHQFLVASLQAAVAFPQMADGTGTVAEHLHFDMPRVTHQLLDVQGAVTERRLGLGLAAGVGFGQRRRLEHRAHATATATGQGLEHHGAMLGAEGLGLFQAHRLVDAGHQRHAAALGQGAGGGFVAEQFEHLRRWADKGDAGGLAAAGELGVLGEEAVTGVDGVAALGGGNGDQLVHVQVGRHATAFERHGEVGLARVQAGVVVFGEHRHRTDLQVGAGAGDADGDFAAVGDQQGSKGRAHSRFSNSFFFTLPVAVIGSAATTRISGTL